LNRLSDQAFTSNTLVDKLHAKVFAIFIPQSLVLTAEQQKDFWKEPQTLLSDLPLDQVDVCVDGSLVTEVAITANPVFSPLGPNVAPGTTLSITDGDANAAIYFTQDGTTAPTASTDDKYTSPIKLDTKIGTIKTIKAIAVSPNKQQSAVVSQTFVIVGLNPTAKPAPGEVTTFPANVALTPALTGDSLYYTVDGTDPTTSSSKYDPSKPINIPSAQTLKVIEVPASAPAGPVTTFVYKLD
jgi:hypothetical protein